MIDVPYSFYADTYHGTMSQADFARLSVKASAYIDRVTMGRMADTLPAAMLIRVKLAHCSAADELLLEEQGGGVVSESNDGVSVTYAASKSTQSVAQRLNEAAALYLGGTGLLYRGIG